MTERQRAQSFTHILEAKPKWEKSNRIILDTLTKALNSQIEAVAEECFTHNRNYSTEFYKIGLLRAIQEYTRHRYISIKKILTGNGITIKEPLRGAIEHQMDKDLEMKIQLSDKITLRILNHITSKFRPNIAMTVYRGIFDTTQSVLNNIRPSTTKLHFSREMDATQYLVGTELEVGHIISNRNFVSTSLSKNVSEAFSSGFFKNMNKGGIECCLFHIHLPKDFPSLYVAQFTAHPEENEILLGSCIKFDVIKKEIVDKKQIYHIKPIKPPPSIYDDEIESYTTVEKDDNGVYSKLTSDIITLNQLLDAQNINLVSNLRYDFSCLCNKDCRLEKTWEDVFINLSADQEDIEIIKAQVKILSEEDMSQLVKIYAQHKMNLYMATTVFLVITHFINECDLHQYPQEKRKKYIQNLKKNVRIFSEAFRELKKKYTTTTIHFIMENMNYDKIINNNFYRLPTRHLETYLTILLSQLSIF